MHGHQNIKFCNKELSGSVKGGEFSDYTRNYRLLEEGMRSKEFEAMLLMTPFHVCVSTSNTIHRASVTFVLSCLQNTYEEN